MFSAPSNVDYNIIIDSVVDSTANSEVWRRNAGENEEKERRMFEPALCRYNEGKFFLIIKSGIYKEPSKGW